MPDAALDESSEVEQVGDREHVRLAGRERAPVGVGLLESDLARVAVLAEQHDPHAGVRPGATHVARAHRYLVRRRCNNIATQSGVTIAIGRQPWQCRGPGASERFRKWGGYKFVRTLYDLVVKIVCLKF